MLKDCRGYSSWRSKYLLAMNIKKAVFLRGFKARYRKVQCVTADAPRALLKFLREREFTTPMPIFVLDFATALSKEIFPRMSSFSRPG